MFSKKYFVFCCLPLLLMSACTRNTNPVKNRIPEDQVRVSEENDFARESAQTLSQQEKKKKLEETILKAKEYLAQEDQDINLLGLERNIIEPLKAYATNLEFILRVKSAYGELLDVKDLPFLVHLFNSALVKADQIQEGYLKENAYLNVYKNLIFYSCDKNMSGSCAMVSFYKRWDSSNIVYILQKIYETEDGKSEKVRVLRAALDIVNQQDNAELRFMIVKMILENSEDAMVSEVFGVEKLRGFVRNAFSSSSRSLRSQFVEVIEPLDPWGMNRALTDSSTNKTLLQNSLFDTAVQFLIYDQNGVLMSNLKKASESVAMSDGSDGIWGKEYVVSHLKKTSPRMVDKLLDSRYAEKDEYSYLVFKSFYGQFNLNDSIKFWKFSKKDKANLVKAAKDFIQVQSLRLTLEIQNSLKDAYTLNRQKGIGNFFQDMMIEAEGLRVKWQSLTLKSKKLLDFISRVEGISENNQDYAKLKESVDFIGEQAKDLITFTNMMPMTYLILDEKRGEGSSWSSFREVTLKMCRQEPGYQDLATQLLNGKTCPWYNFDHDQNPYSFNKAIKAFYYVMLSDIFTSESAVYPSLVSFLDQLIESYTKDYVEVLRAATLKINNLDMLNSTAMNSMASFCSDLGSVMGGYYSKAAGLENNLPYFDLQGFPANQLKFTTSVQFEDIASEKSALLEYTQTNQAGKYGKVFSGVYGGSILETLRALRVDRGKINITLKIMKKIVAQVLSEQSAAYAVLEKHSQELEEKRMVFLKSYLPKLQRYESCVWPLLFTQQEMKMQIFEKEKAFLEGLFDLLQKNNLKKVNSYILAESFEENLRRSSYYPAQFRNDDNVLQVKGDEILFSKLLSMARLKHHLEETYPNHYVITAPTNFMFSKVYTVPDFNTLSYGSNVNKENFVAQGLRSYFSHLPVMKLNDSSSSFYNTYVKQQVQVYLELYGLLVEDPESLKPFGLSKDKLLQKMLNDHVQNLSHLYISDREDAIFSQTNTEFQYSERLLDLSIKFEGESRLYSLFDKVYEAVALVNPEEQLSALWYQDYLIDFATYKVNKNARLFEYPEYIDESLEKSYVEWLNEYKSSYISLRQEIGKYKLDKKFSEIFSSYRYEVGKPPIAIEFSESAPLSEYILNSQKIFIEDFNEDTQSYFKDHISVEDLGGK